MVQNPIFNSKVYTDVNGVEQYGIDPKEVEAYAQQQRNAGNSLITNKKKYPASIIDTGGAVKSLNKQYSKLTNLANNRVKISLPQEQFNQTFQQDLANGDVASVVTNQGTFTLDEAMQLFGNDFTGLTQNSDGTFSASTQALENIGITGLSTSDPSNQYQDEINSFDSQIQSLMNNFNSYNVDNDPDFQAEASSIRSLYDRMREEMRQTNYQRQRAYETLGYRTGSTQYAGAIAGGIVGEEINQGNERLAEINRQESAAISSARKAYKEGKYTEFANQIKNLDTLRDNKAQALADYNKSLADTYANMQKQNQFELDVLKYQLDLQKSGQTDLTKEYEYAKLEGLPEGVNNLMDYQLWKEETTTARPSSYQEWSLAGGEDGTGMTYSEYLKDKGTSTEPTSYREWQLAGSTDGTGQTYGEWLQTKTEKPITANQFTAANYASRIEQANAIIDSLDEKFASKINAIGKFLPEFLKSEDRKLLDQAKRNFINSVLRRESGAAIADSEFESAEKQYFPQAGDTTDVLNQKKANRQLVLRNLISEAGKAFESSITLDQYYLQNPKEQASIEKMIGDNPNLSDDEIMQIITGQISFNNAGDTNISLDKLSSAIGQFESGGNYKAIGPDTGKGNKAYGKYQIMASNIPSWSKEALGYSITPQKFLDNPKLQDKIAQYKMNQYLKKYGTIEDVASVWFSGRPLAKAGNAKDVIGTSVPKYVKNIRAIYNNLS